MLFRIWRVARTALTLALVACCGYLLWRDSHPSVAPPVSGTGRPSLQADTALRSFLDAKSIGGEYELPENENYGVIAVLAFEDGKFRGRRGQWAITGIPGGTRAVSYQLLWGQGADGPRAVGGTRTPDDAAHTVFRKEDGAFLCGLDGPWNSTRSAPSEEVRGYRVLGHILSSEIRPGRSGTFGRVVDDIENRQTVAVVGVKTFPTASQSSEWFFTREPLDP
ncbi:hypothetical protein [Frigoriglobus tundricola]|uniref:Uncharacterized protein n=1 Tax=Frigoriglobus tundricola TaxID=2774151 RepID=A0A6M5YS51_9BACT|nr:hypothetical protein [Frigoriglobus tundricola]QJW96244.1 hypothetical protein FTUN_3801 [Frigoriglobus tundricola]